MAQLCKIILGNCPPCLQGLVVGGKGSVEGRIGIQNGLDGGLGVDCRAKGQIPWTVGLKQRVGFDIK